MTALSARFAETSRLDSDPADTEMLDGFCANPRCDVRMEHSTGPGRRAKYHDAACKRDAEKMQRRLEGRLRHFAAQVEMVQRQLMAYEEQRPHAEAAPSASARDLHDAQVALARAEAVTELLDEPGSKAAAELVRLVEAVAPALK
jgi:hypothetical protein